MSKNSRYFSAYPTINPSYLSSGASRDVNNYTFEDIVRPNQNAFKSNVIVQPNINFDVFKNYKNDLEPISTSNFNVIGVSVDTNIVNGNGFPINNDNDIIFLDVLQGQNKSDMVVSYSTPILPNNVFYRNYPVKNNLCNIRFRNEKSSNVHVSYDISLSKFTQFNPPSQLGDDVEFAEMSNLIRSGNDFYDDVSREQFENAKIINRFGYLKDNVNSTQIISPILLEENTSNTFAEVFGISDSASDVFNMDISGETDLFNLGRINNRITLLGTSNSTISINRYKYIDTVDLLGNNNTGNISIYKTGTLDAVAYIPKGFANVSSPIYYINKIEEGVLKEVKLNGSVKIQNGSVQVRLAQGSSVKTIWSSGIINSDVKNVWKPDYKIPSNSTIYAIVEDIDTTIYADERIDISMKILKYEKQPVNSLNP
jgi:hypothetical protein